MIHEELEEILEQHRKWRQDPTTGKRADLRDADLRDANLRGANLRGAKLRGVDLWGVDLWGADLQGAKLRDADLRGVDLRGVDLQGVEGCVRLDLVDPREYQPVAVATDDGWRIYSGCRSLTIAEALEHWGETYDGEREIGDRYLRAIKALPPCTEETT